MDIGISRAEALRRLGMETERRELVVREAAIESSRRGDGRFLEAPEPPDPYAKYDGLDELEKRRLDGDR